MIVNINNFYDVLNDILKSSSFSFDCESTGLRVHHGDRLFSLSIAIKDTTYYFNFKNYNDGNPYLPFDYIVHLNRLFSARTGVAANAKFDMHLLANEGLVFAVDFKVWDVLVIDKLIYNRHMSYSLDSVAERNGFQKLDTVEKYIVEHKLSTMTTIPGKDKRVRIPHYDQVPFSIMREYACQDANITYKIYEKQLAAVAVIEQDNIRLKQPSFAKVVELENEVTKVCFDIERRGMKIDAEYIRRVSAYEQTRALHAVKEYEEISGTSFVDSAKAHKPVFELLGLSSGKTQKGGVSFSDETLTNCKHPIAEHIRNYRDSSKRLKSYYQNFLYEADKDGIVHPNIKQTAADTYRFSITSPALQTLNSEEDGEYKVRNSFVARDGFQFLSIDYSSQEYRLTAAYSNQESLIKAINEGQDVHQATADLMGVNRQQAKVLNFALLYGAGSQKVAGMLGITEPEAKALKNKYFSSLGMIKKFVRDVSNVINTRGYTFNFAGYRLYFPYLEVNGERFNLSYKGPNYLIQSSGAAIMRMALIKVHKFLRPYKSKIVLSIHDEALIELHDDEHHLIEPIRKIMKEVFIPMNNLGMETSFSLAKSWGDV
jgi:DNA polymerase-1